MTEKKFDLNIESILEDWEVYHALREVIANAIDEQLLSETENIEIFEDKGGSYHIRDYGRGLKYEHLTQNEDEEKINHEHTIGKFGIGLKDALATFHRKGVEVFIKSKFGNIRTGLSSKAGFNDVYTLHAYISSPTDPIMSGTEFIFKEIKKSDMEKAKNLFLCFSGEENIERTPYGEVLRKKGKNGRIYINGVRVAEEENFLFSYNITSLTKKIKKALNRERSNVGRSAYSDRVMRILKSCESIEVANSLVEDLKNFSLGTMHDEVKRLDIQIHAVKILNAQEKTIFLTPEEVITKTMMVDEAKSAGYTIIHIPENLKDKIKGEKDISGDTIRDLDEFMMEYSESFEYSFVDTNLLDPDEKSIFRLTDDIFDLIGGRPKTIQDIRISETMKKDLTTFQDANGIFERTTRTIIIKRSQLRNLESYCGTLLHEVSHVISGKEDVTRGFELELTRIIGCVSEKALSK